MAAFLFLLLALAVLSLALAGELEIIVTNEVECEDSEKSKAGDHLFMHYTGSIDESSETGEHGKVFDSSLTRGQPFDFPLGAGRVIQGWDQGLLDMCPGDKRTLIIPPELGYGAQGAGGTIPGGATLKFEVECLKIGDASDRPAEPNIFAEIDADSSGDITYEEMETWFKESRGEADVPEGLWEQEDKNFDKVITWEEFSGPKGTAPPGEEEL
jgi:hypothetical protein